MTGEETIRVMMSTMSAARMLKQATYAGGCLTVVLAVAALVLFSSSRLSSGPSSTVTPAPTVAYQPIQVEQVDAVRHEQSVDIVARLRNPNARAGAAQYIVTFVLTDSSGNEIGRHRETAYVLPGAIQYVVAVNVPVPVSLGGIEVELPAEPVFLDTPATVALPSFSSFVRERTTRLTGNTTIEEQKGVVRNTSTVDWQRVEVIGIALDENNRALGAGKTFVGELRVGEEREFTLQWPATAQPIARVLVVPTTNIYVEENILRIIGDPSLLR